MIWPFLLTFHPQKCEFDFGKQFNELMLHYAKMSGRNKNM